MTDNLVPPRVFATNDDYATGPDTGTPTKVDPASDANGFINGQIIAAQHVNYWLNAVTQYLLDRDNAFFVNEDFAGAIFDSGESRVDASFPWRTIHTGSVSINGNAGSAKNPGLLRCSIPTAESFVFHLHTAAGAPLTYASFRRLRVTVSVTSDPTNVADEVMFGLADDASDINDPDHLLVWWNHGVDADNWILRRRVGSVQTNTVLASAAFVDGEFADWDLIKTEAGDVELYLNGVLVHTVDAADLPSGGANLMCRCDTSVADPEVLTVDWDRVQLWTRPPNFRDGP